MPSNKALQNFSDVFSTSAMMNLQLISEVGNAPLNRERFVNVTIFKYQLSGVFIVTMHDPQQWSILKM